MLTFVKKKKPAKVVAFTPKVQPFIRRVYHADLFDLLPTFDRDSLDVCVTDPPYGLEFMGKEWDKLGLEQLTIVNGRRGQTPTDAANRGMNESALVHAPGFDYTLTAKRAAQRWHELWAEEVWRVLKPGAYLVAFGGTRMYHRLTCALEDAGFEVRDCLMWLYGTGFPKSLNISKELDDMAGAVRTEVIGTSSGPNASQYTGERYTQYRHTSFGDVQDQPTKFAPVTEAAQYWEGWGTALKPAWEPIILARKPLRGTVAENVLQFGTGGLNIDASRVGRVEGDRTAYGVSGDEAAPQRHAYQPTGRVPYETRTQGRWPANLIIDEEVAVQLDAQSGETLSSGGRNANISKTSQIYGGGKGLGRDLSPDSVKGDPGYGDKGGASRFFYCAKPSRTERDIGCEHLPERSGGEATDRVDGTEGLNSPRAGAGRTGGSKNTHPTVKPLSLMRYLVKLVTPPGGIVLDPFLGSGTTAMACIQEGFGYVGVEKEKDSILIAEHRIAGIVKLTEEEAEIEASVPQDVALPL